MRLDHVTRTFGGGTLSTKPPIVAVDDVSLSINEDEPKITTIAGESGSGKTTLARLLMGTITPSFGSMYYRGKDFTKLSRQGFVELQTGSPIHLPRPVRLLQPVLQGRSRPRNPD